MSTFQAVVMSIIHGFSEFFPVGVNAHSVLTPEIFKWSPSPPAFEGAAGLGATLALLVYFRHDWLSQISSFLQVIIYRKYPMSLDERLPFFILIATTPPLITWMLLPPLLAPFNLNLYWAIAGLFAFALPLLFLDSWSRKTKAMFDWNWLDALIVGIFQSLLFLPGLGRMTAALLGGLFRNYSREAASKFAFYTALPMTAGSAIFHLKDFSIQELRLHSELSLLTFGVTLIVSFGVSLLAISSFLNHSQKGTLKGFAFYRISFAMIAASILWLRSKGMILF